MTGMSPKASIRVVLDVTYEVLDTDAHSMSAEVQNRLIRAIGSGLLTGDSSAEVDSYKVKAAVRVEPIDEDSLASFMFDRIDTGDLALEDIPVRLARYGIMEPDDFLVEMRLRMNQLGLTH